MNIITLRDKNKLHQIKYQHTIHLTKLAGFINKLTTIKQDVPTWNVVMVRHFTNNGYRWLFRALKTAWMFEHHGLTSGTIAS